MGNVNVYGLFSMAGSLVWEFFFGVLSEALFFGDLWVCAVLISRLECQKAG